VRKRESEKGEELSGNGYMAWWFVNVGIIAGNLRRKDRSAQACSECIADFLVPTLLLNG